MYERPATGFVAGFVGVSNVLSGEVAKAITGDEHAFTIRPEKISMETGEGAVDPDRCTATGHVREVVYLGAVTRYIVELDSGRELVVMQQNLTTSSMEALQVRGRAVRLVWSRSNNRLVRRRPAPRATTSTRRRSHDETVRLLSLAAVMGLVAIACSNNSSTSTSAGGSTSGGAPASIGPGEADHLGRVVEAATPEVRWVKPFEAGHRLQGGREVRHTPPRW